ncbi:hypothetical protein [Clostridium hydrogeniformans]|uniref:hypothetical protein n=1 Tax=Clostridium hydrogeniformans TaxID=349933 RepID=UPI000484E0FF|nr:hypothetical protein [Clostridium hydrogeniformans]
MTVYYNLDSNDLESTYGKDILCRVDEYIEGGILVKDLPSSQLIAMENGTIILKPNEIKSINLNNDKFLNFMEEVYIYSKALKTFTGALKINHEIYGDNIGELYIGLFPQYNKSMDKTSDIKRTGEFIYSIDELEKFLMNII